MGHSPTPHVRPNRGVANQTSRNAFGANGSSSDWKWRLRRLQPRITKIGTCIHTDVLNNYAGTGYDVTDYFRLNSYWSSKNGLKCRLRRLQVEFLEKGSSEDHHIPQCCRGQLAPQICRIWRHYLLPVGCKMQSNARISAQKWCIKRVRPAKESNNSVTV